MNKIDKSLVFKDNPRVITDKQLTRLEEDLRKFGDLSGVVYCRNNKSYVGGNQRSKIFDGCKITLINKFDKPHKDGTVAVGFIEWNGNKYLYREVEFTEAQFREACIVANNDGGDWDFDLLKEWNIDELASWDFDTSFFEEYNTPQNRELNKQEVAKNLKERFIVPPFSILDTRQGYWQDRKNEWLKLGIRSDESRDNMQVSGSYAGSVPRYYSYKEETELKIGKKLTHKEFADSYLQEYIDKSSLAYTNSGGILSIFDPVLCEILYRWFCVEGGQIFDLFAGGSVRGIVAGMLGYKYFGIDLRREQVDANKQQKEDIIPNASVSWVVGNSLNTKDICKDFKVDFVFSCPPYFDLEIYSNNKEDLSNMTWENFSVQYREIIRQSIALLKEDSFACFVVGEVRNKKSGFYRNFIGETIKAFEDAGALFYNEMILVNVVGSLPTRVATMFKSRKIGKCHQNVLVFYKGDVKHIKDKFFNSDFSVSEIEFKVLS